MNKSELNNLDGFSKKYTDEKVFSATSSITPLEWGNIGGTVSLQGDLTTYINSLEKFVSSGVYSTSSGTLTFTHNTGNTFSVTGFDIEKFVSSGTYSQNTGIATYQHNTGTTFSVSGFFYQQFGTVTTTNATITNIHTITPIDGVYTVEYKITAFQSSTGNALGDKLYGIFKVIGGVITQVGTIDTARKSNFLPLVQPSLDTNGTIIRARATGLAGATIVWTATLEINRIN